jgi:hypothetical protein
MRMLRRLFLAALPAFALLVPASALAGAPALQITPLQYEDNLSTTVKNGHIDVSNPTDAAVTIEASIRGFRQQGTDGDLSFYDDQDLAAAIKLDVSSFELAPRDAIRVLFSVDPAKLPPGGTYAAIFFRTTPNEHSSGNTSYVAQSANVGTLLILRNGGPAPTGGVKVLSLPFWQFGSGIGGAATVANTSKSPGGVAFRPALTARVLPWGKAVQQKYGLILPGSTRKFTVWRPGAFFGLLPVTVIDGSTHTHRTVWVFAVTGWWGWVVLVALLAAAVLAFLLLTKRVSIRDSIRTGFRKLLRKLRRRKPAVKKPMDGLSPKKK